MTLYYFYKECNDKKFEEICEYIEFIYPDFVKESLLIDVDFSMIQVYEKGDKKIVVVNDAESDIIIARSNLDLKNFKYTIAYLENDELIYT